jgi:cellulose synthase/poly-beta-1,6-N-acetylglucosamine synthase-like glycosyltransferase
LVTAGRLDAGVLVERLTTEGLWKLERVDDEGTAGTTKVEEAFFVVFFALFFTALFFTALFFTALFFTALFFTAFLAGAFFTDRLATLFFADFLAEVFFADFFAVFLAVFLTATVMLLGLRFWLEIEIQF